MLVESLEPLEPRRFLSAGTVNINNGTVQFQASSGGFGITHFDSVTLDAWRVVTHTGTLVVKGTDGDDHISVIQDGNWIKYSSSAVGAGGATVVVAANEVKRVYVEAGGGHDKVFVDPELQKPCTVLGGAGDDVIDGNARTTLFGGSGNDRLYAAHSSDVRFVVQPGAGGTEVFSSSQSVLVGGAGDDTLVGGDGDSLVGGLGHDTGVLFIPNPSPGTTIVDGRINGKTVAELFPDAAGVEAFTAKVGNAEILMLTTP